MTVVGEKMRVALPLGWSALGLAGLALATGLGWLYLALVRDIDDMVRSTIAQFMGTLPLFIGLGLFSFRRACDFDRRAGLVIKWWGLLWPWSRHVFDLNLFDKVNLGRSPSDWARGAGRRSLRNIPCGLRARNAWLCVWI